VSQQTSYRQHQQKASKHEAILETTICVELFQDIAEHLMPWEDEDDVSKRAGRKLQAAS